MRHKLADGDVLGSRDFFRFWKITNNRPISEKVGVQDIDIDIVATCNGRPIIKSSVESPRRSLLKPF